MSQNYTYHPPDITIDLSFILSSLRILIVKIYYIYIHTMSVLMLLSRLAGAGNFYFNSFLPFLSVVSVLSCQAMSFQILFCELFPRFPWSTFFLFPSYFNFSSSITSRICELMSPHMTWPYTGDSFELYPRFSQQHPSYPKNISRHPINQSYPTHQPNHTTFHPTQPGLFCNNLFPRFTTVQQIGLTQHLQIFLGCFKDKLCFSTNTT